MKSRYTNVILLGLAAWAVTASLAWGFDWHRGMLRRVELGSVPAWATLLAASAASITGVLALQRETARREKEDEQVWWARAQSVVRTTNEKPVTGAHSTEIGFSVRNFGELPIFSLTFKPLTQGGMTVWTEKGTANSVSTQNGIELAAVLPPGENREITYVVKSDTKWRLDSTEFKFLDATGQTWSSAPDGRWVPHLETGK